MMSTIRKTRIGITITVARSHVGMDSLPIAGKERLFAEAKYGYERLGSYEYIHLSSNNAINVFAHNFEGSCYISFLKSMTE
jgi:hypothetical protein